MNGQIGKELVKNGKGIMTEKRFKADKYFEVWDNNDFLLSFDQTVDLLNQLNEENEQLKSIKKFADRNGICIFNIDEAFRRCWQDNAKLVKENEQLKKENLDLLEELDYYKTKCASLENGLFQADRENGQLKKELKRCKDWINSDKNDYELTLAFIKNKGYSLKDVLEYEKELKSE